jgi:hypothetical protein
VIAVFIFVLPGIMIHPTSDDNVGWMAGLFIPWLAALIALYWFFTRRLGHAAPNEEGSFSAWFGWSLVAAIPMLLLVIALVTLGALEDSKAFDAMLPWWAQSLLFSIALALPIPFLVQSTGRAIDRNGPALGVVWNNLKAHYAVILIAYLVTLLPSLLGDALTEGFGGKYGNGATNAASVFGWLCYFAQFLLSTSLLAFVWRSLPMTSLEIDAAP